MSGRALVPIDLGPLDARGIASNRKRVENGLWPKVRRLLGRVPFLDEALAAYYCARDPATPTRAKAVLLAALAYFVLPADLIPDMVAGLGFTDDATVLLTTLQLFGAHIKEGHRTEARAALHRLKRDSTPD